MGLYTMRGGDRERPAPFPRLWQTLELLQITKMARKHVNWKVAKQPNTALAMANNSTDSALQNVPTSFFAQLIELLPKDRLLAHFDNHCPRRSATKFSAWDHFIALLFCHLAGCDSLREIDDGLYSACGKLNHLDARPMKRTAHWLMPTRHVPTESSNSATCCCWTTSSRCWETDD